MASCSVPGHGACCFLLCRQWTQGLSGLEFCDDVKLPTWQINGDHVCDNPEGPWGRVPPEASCRRAVGDGAFRPAHFQFSSVTQPKAGHLLENTISRSWAGTAVCTGPLGADWPGWVSATLSRNDRTQQLLAKFQRLCFKVYFLMLTLL